MNCPWATRLVKSSFSVKERGFKITKGLASSSSKSSCCSGKSTAQKGQSEAAQLKLIISGPYGRVPRWSTSLFRAVSVAQIA